MKKSKSQTKSGELLRKNGFKITPLRVAILDILVQKNKPMSVEDIQKLLKKKINKTTIYRALSGFVEKGILYQTNFRDTKNYYEYQELHHHHIVCTSCGAKEEVLFCKNLPLPQVAKNSQKFNQINDHILEFFGVCNLCEAN